MSAAFLGTLYLPFLLCITPLQQAPPRTALVFEEELRIGPDDGASDAFIWTGTFVSVDADPAGTMYVTDGGGNRVVVVDADGAYVGQIGGPGEGPGEFKALRKFVVLPDGTGLALENENYANRLHRFDAQRRFVTRQNFAPGYSLGESAVSPTGKMLGGTASSAQGDVERIDFALFDVADGHLVLSFFHNEAKNDFDYAKMGERGFWARFIPSRLQFYAQGRVGYVAFDGDGGAYTAVGHTYEITRWSPEGKRLGTITRAYQPIPQPMEQIAAFAEQTRERLISQLPHLKGLFSDDLMREAIAASGFLPRKHPVYGLVAMADGTLVVCHNYNEKTLETQGDVFDPAGRYLGACTLPNGALLRMTFKGGKAYTIESVNGEKHLVRYGYTLRAAAPPTGKPAGG